MQDTSPEAVQLAEQIVALSKRPGFEKTLAMYIESYVDFRVKRAVDKAFARKEKEKER